MKFTLSWLLEHLETDKSCDEIVEKLSMIGLEVEGVEDRSKGLETFKIAEIVECEQHPDADKLRLLKVFDGEKDYQVVCGAPNARKGLKGVFATDGSYIPGLDVTLKPTKIRGVESFGMMMSEAEMLLSEDHDGIVDLPVETEVGARAVDIMGLTDPIIEIAITPNRGDCAGVRGIARDLAATGFGSLKPINTDAVEGTYESPVKINLHNPAEGPAICSQFAGRYIRGVKNGPSPKWLQEKLLAVGLRPISALVDVTNYFSQGLCRPLHVFDADKLSGDIHVRLAKEGEMLKALDEKEYTLDGDMTVVCDDATPHALAGIMGGEVSGCQDDTVNVFLECALFDPIRTAMTGRKLDIISDARYRFERGVDEAAVVDMTEMASRLIIEICGGEASKLVVAGDEPKWQRNITLRKARVKQLTGVDVPVEEMARILKTLGCELTDKGETFDVQPPSWRSDIEMEACLVEEVIRVYGYDKIEEVSLVRETNLPVVALTPMQQKRDAARRTLVSRGVSEAVTYAFLPEKQAKLFGWTDENLRLTNPISTDLEIMRPSLLPNLLSACQRNNNNGYPNGCLFEVGPQFDGDTADQQPIVVCGVRTGQTAQRNWAESPRRVDVFDAKADAMAVLEAAGAKVESLQVDPEGAPAHYHPGRSGAFKLGPKNTLAYFGELHPGVLKKMGYKGIAVGFEIYLDAIPAPKAKKTGALRPLLVLSQFQPVDRDFAFVVDSDIPAAKIIQSAKTADKKLITDAAVFDVYEGENMEEGKKSVAITIKLQPTTETLTDEQIQAVCDKVVANVAKNTGGELRG
ncbi:Phenylalanine--tRNA ligase beta subunit [Candidatus Terasakiella magnetica]|uniref:Phenylalanine--tRNA ligase beta subunit n=1 Tax=Candidatus Terasakiella magnetica TaxID=1867952 RepID=A0A1C3RJ29_9PROT|nr:phenylalanine--tRNA ligase subunit beta [Candidatus Terasakiella magnetica]SCA57265.1 Phenylalanine--tRNA ligase beta subunit [Candidatus Terasakiella magnetica]